jgi:hypothetical protein
MTGRLKAALDWVATIAMIGAAFAVIWVTVFRPAKPPESQSRDTVVTGGPSGSERYQSGEKIGVIPGFDPNGSERTLILFLRSGCVYCTQSMDFYKRLAAIPGRPRLVVMGPEPEQTLRDYIKQYGLTADQVLTVLPPAVKFRGTPGLALIRADGTVEAAWLGKLEDEREQTVIKALGG